MGGVSQGRGLRGRGLWWAGPPQSLPQAVRALRGGGGCGGCTGTEVSGDPFSRRGEARRGGREGSWAREMGLHTLSQEARPGRRRESMCASARECRGASGGGVGVGATSRQERPLKEYSISVSLPGYSRFVPQRPLPRPLLLMSEFLSISVGGSRWGQSSPLSSRLAILSPCLYHDPSQCLLIIEVCPSLSIIPLNRANNGRRRGTLVSKLFLAQAVPPTPSGL